MNERNNLTTYSYHEERVEFGQYDIMFPQTTNQIHKEVKFSCGSDLYEYFEHYYKFLLDALRVIRSDDVRMETNGALAPTLFKSEESSDYLCLVMPVQVK